MIRNFAGGILLFTACTAFAADSKSEPADTLLTFSEVKDRLVRSNLALLAAHYDVSIAEAGVVQARLWNNPYFVFNGDLYSNEANEYFHFRNQHLLQVEQTFSIAGKHTHTVRLARLGAEMAARQLEDVLRSLLYEAGNLYSELAALQAKSEVYRQVSESYARLIESTRQQLEIGSISQMEAIRLESEFLALKTEAITNGNEQARVLSELRTLLRMPEDTVFWVRQTLPVVAALPDHRVLSDQAIQSRPDLALLRTNVRYQERNLRLQRATGVPDVKLAYQPRDRGSNYVRPYQGFNVEFNIPLFDRNQGEIQAAKHNVVKSDLDYQQSENRIRNEVASASVRFQSAWSGLANYSPSLLNRLDELNSSTQDNFRKRNISLLQFIDQQRIYTQTNLQLIELRQQFLSHVNDLNFAVGTTLIEY